MAKKKEGTQGKLESRDKPKSKIKAEVTKPMKVEITFPMITDLKQAIGMDGDGNLVATIQFKSKVDQFELFRLINLLKQPHGVIYAVIGSPQSAMDFKFDAKQIRFEIFQAQKQIEASKKEAPVQPAREGTVVNVKASKIHMVVFNHIPDEEKPYGVAIDFVADGTGEIHTVAGRGMNPTEAVMAGIVKILPDFPEDGEPFQAMAALEELDPSPEGYKLIRAIEVGSFDIESDEDKGADTKKKG